MKKKLLKAAALEYNKTAAPVVTSKGEGKTAERIIEIAKKNNVYVHKDNDLIEILSKLDIGEEIPHEIYNAVAQILLFVYEINGKKQ